MNILLVYPKFPVSYWGFHYSLEIIDKKAAMPPLGLLTIAAMFPEDWNLRLVDMNVEELNRSDIEWAQLVVMSGMLVQHTSMQAVIRECKQLGVSVAVGGPHATSSPERFQDADFLLLDEAEITLPPFLKDFIERCPKRVYTASGQKPDVTTTPIPRFDLLKMDRYASMCIQFSRGCPFACEFCDITTLYGRTPRTKTPQQMVNELQALYELDFRGAVFIVDDNFIGNKKNVKAMLPSMTAWMKEHDYPFTLFTEASVNLADDDELLELMSDAGVNCVFVGIESPSLESLRETHKFQNANGDLLSKIHKLHDYGIEVMGGFILGFDNDHEDIFQRQIEFITASRIPLAMVGTLQALPNTQLWTRLQNEGRLLTEGGGDQFDLPNFVTKMPPKTLLEGYRTVLKTLYSPANYFNRLYDLVVAIKTQRSAALAKHSLRKKLELLLFGLRSLVIQGILSSYRWDYWQFLGRVLLNHPAKYQLAIKRSIFGHHCIKYTMEVVVPRLIDHEARLQSATTSLV